MATERMSLRKKRIVAAIVIGIGLPYLVVIGSMWHRHRELVDARTFLRKYPEQRASISKIAALTWKTNVADTLRTNERLVRMAKESLVWMDSMKIACSTLVAEVDRHK